jgi:hypothetical protein
MKTKTSANDYPFLREWHRTTGSFLPYIENLLQQARTDNAPQTAIYKHKEDPHENRSSRERWVTFDPQKAETPISTAVLRDVRRHYGLTYTDVLAWDNPPVSE